MSLLLWKLRRRRSVSVIRRSRSIRTPVWWCCTPRRLPRNQESSSESDFPHATICCSDVAQPQQVALDSRLFLFSCLMGVWRIWEWPRFSGDTVDGRTRQFSLLPTRGGRVTVCFQTVRTTMGRMLVWRRPLTQDKPVISDVSLPVWRWEASGSVTNVKMNKHNNKSLVGWAHCYFHAQHKTVFKESFLQINPVFWDFTPNLQQHQDQSQESQDNVNSKVSKSLPHRPKTFSKTDPH